LFDNRSFSFTGIWEGSTPSWTIYDPNNAGGPYSSYTYKYADKTTALGYEAGTKVAPGIVATNFFENGMKKQPYNGIDIWVAKNTTAFYSAFWNFPSDSLFDYNKKNDPNFFAQSLNIKKTGKKATSTTSLAKVNYCSILPTYVEQTACWKKK